VENKEQEIRKGHETQSSMKTVAHKVLLFKTTPKTEAVLASFPIGRKSQSSSHVRLSIVTAVTKNKVRTEIPSLELLSFS